MITPSISVVMPAFNAEPYIGAAIASVLAQDRSDWELIIVNDGSTDGTAQVIAGFADPRINVVHVANGGVSRARNTALDLARGDLICFLDADDLLPPGSLAARAELLENDPTLAFADGVVLPLNEDRRDAKPMYRPTFQGPPFGELMRLSSACFFGTTWMIRREAIGTHRFPEHMRHAEDLAFYLTIARNGRYGHTDHPVLLCRRGHGSAMSDLDGLDHGYQALHRYVQHLDPPPSHVQMLELTKRIRSVMAKSHLKAGRPWSAIRALLRRMPIHRTGKPARNVLFLSYWSLREPLTAAAIFPYLRILSEKENIDRIHLVTMETTSEFLPEVELDIPKVRHMAILPRWQRIFHLSKVDLYLRSIATMVGLVRREDIGLILAKGSMAGTIAHFVHRRTDVPFIVESFEPHSRYMLACGVWPKWGSRYLFTAFMEHTQLRTASHIITVTENLARDLKSAGYDPQRIHMVPSITDLEKFRHRPQDRAIVRERLGIAVNATAGIYVGKFGGLYFGREAFTLFQRAFAHFHDLHIVVLSPMDPEVIQAMAREAGIDPQRFHLYIAPHDEVPTYLSAADFAFSPIKPAPVKRYQCPIKNGEYWASGLPIVMTDGISDEHLLMREGIGGAVYGADLSGMDEAFATIKEIMKRPGYRVEITALAERYRSVRIARKVYDDIL